MNIEQYERLISWALKRGLFLHEGIERKQVNGVYGMYATQDIAANSIVVSFPEQALLKPAKTIDFGTGTDSIDLNYIYAAAKELDKGQGSEYSGLFDGFETLEDMRAYSTHFISMSELEVLQRMSSTAYIWVNNANQNVQKAIEAIIRADGRVDPDSVLTVLLNYRSRSFRNLGVVPVVDLFNHSDRLGLENDLIDGKVCVRTRINYRSGEEIFISYGRKDLLQHAVQYNYFDPQGTHFIEPACRLFSTLGSARDQQIFDQLSRRYKFQTSVSEGQTSFFLDDRNALVTEAAPTPYLLQYLGDSIRAGINQDLPGPQLYGHLLTSYAQLLDALLVTNRREEVRREELSPRLLRFYDLLGKEVQMIEANRQWIIDHA